jgi:hypothetical protein
LIQRIRSAFSSRVEAGVVQASVEAVMQEAVDVVMQEAVEAQAPGAAVMQGAAGAELPGAAVMQGAAGAELPAAVEVGIGRKPSASGRRTVPVPQPAKVVTRKSNRREVHKLSVWKNI